MANGNNWLENIFVDPINTGANIFGVAVSAESVELSKKQYQLSQETFKFNLDNNKSEKMFNEELKTILNNILEELVLLNNNISNLK